MINDKKVIAFIPVRAGSKGIPNKNIKDFCGVPLVNIQTSVLLNVPLIDKVVISTDIEYIKDNYIQHDGFEIFDRSPETATDEASTESVMLDYIERKNLADEIFILVQATNPFTKKEDYMKALKMLDNYDSVLSVVKLDRFFWKNGISVNYNYKNRKRRQELINSELYIENGAFYISTVNQIKIHNNRLSGNIGQYEMDQHSLFEIDTEEDWELCELLYDFYK